SLELGHIRPLRQTSTDLRPTIKRQYASSCYLRNVNFPAKKNARNFARARMKGISIAIGLGQKPSIERASVIVGRELELWCRLECCFMGGCFLSDKRPATKT